MVYLASLIATVASIATLVNGFQIKVSGKGSMIDSAQVHVNEYGALFLDHIYSTEPAEFEFRENELVVAGTDKYVHVLENGECYVIEKKLSPANSRTSGFHYSRGFLWFNDGGSYYSFDNPGMQRIYFLPSNGKRDSNWRPISLSIY